MIGILTSTLAIYAQPDIAKAEAMYIYNFMRYIEWPAEKTGDVYIIGVLGDSPVYKALKEYTYQKEVGGKRIQVVRYLTIEEASKSHILFISDDKSIYMPQILHGLKGKSCLPVFENGPNTQSKAVIDFVKVDQKLKYRVNDKDVSIYKLVISNILIKMSI